MTQFLIKGKHYLENYIIHIYRRDEANPDAVSGTMEGHDLKKVFAFSDINDVMGILRGEKQKKMRKKFHRPAGEKKAAISYRSSAGGHMI